MGAWVFWGVFAAVAVGIGVITIVVRRKLRNFSQRVFGTSSLLEGLQATDAVGRDDPRSVSGCDSLLLPQILKDFPDFDVELAKTYARDYLREQLGDYESLTIYSVVINRYHRTGAQRMIVFQSAVSYIDGGEKLQKRYDLDYTFLLPTVDSEVAANCPNCGGALGYGVTVCPYCGSRVANALKNAWHFTEMRES